MFVEFAENFLKGLLNHSFKTLILNETKVDLLDDCLIPNGYTYISKEKNSSRKVPHGGIHGLGVLVRTNIICHISVIKNLTSESILLLNISEKAFGYPFLLGAVYIPPENSKYNDDSMFDDISNDFIFLKNKFDLPLCLIGDFNARTGDCSELLLDEECINSFTTQPTTYRNCEELHRSDLFNTTICPDRNNKDKVINNHGKHLIELCKCFRMVILNGRSASDKNGQYTCANSSTIDYCIASIDLLHVFEDFSVDIFDPLLSDKHCPVMLTLSLCRNAVSNVKQTEDYQPRRVTKVKWSGSLAKDFENNIDIEAVENLYNKLDGMSSGKISQEELDDLVSTVQNLYLDAAKSCDMVKTHFHRKTKVNKNNNSKPWFDSNCKKSRSKYFRLKHLLKSEKTLNREQISEELVKQKRIYKKELKKAKTEYNKILHSKLRDAKLTQPSEYWNMLSSLDSKKNQIDIDLNTLEEHFRNLSQTQNTQGFSLKTDIPENSSNDFLNRPIDINELVTQVKRLKNGKAHGVDQILNEFLKNSSGRLLSCIVLLFNIVFDSGVVPTDWTIGLIRPLYKKKGDPKDPNNFRGITLLSCLGKLFTSILNKRLTTYLEDNDLLGEEQAGFRNGHSTLDHIFALHSIIDLYLSESKRVYCAFIDYKKAFDLVDRSALWIKLMNTNVNGKFFQIIYNMYGQAKSCVIKDNEMSSLFECNIGVRQGENLSPMLFALFLNDFSLFLQDKCCGINLLPKKLNKHAKQNEIQVYIKLFTLLYADDTLVLAESPEDLQTALDALHEYCNTWSLHVNSDKTKIVVFSRGKVRRLPSFHFNNRELSVVDDYVYLGITFNYNNRFKKAQTKQLNQARRAMYSLLTKSYSLDLPIDIMLELFDQLVIPVLLYGSEIWGFDVIRDLEVFHMKFCKQILKFNKSTANCMVLGELGRYNLEKYISNRMINFWCSLEHSGENKLSGIIYRVLKVLYNENVYQSPWLKKIKTTIDMLGMSDLWYTCETTNCNWIKCTIDQRLKDCLTQNWCSTIYDHPQCVNYRIFKKSLELEKFIIDLPKKYRICISKFRCENHRLPIVTGRYQNVERSNRICNLCQSRLIGDEFHYLFVCPAFSTDRKLYLDTYFTERPNTYKMEQFFNTDNLNTLLNIAKFCPKIMLRF